MKTLTDNERQRVKTTLKEMLENGILLAFLKPNLGFLIAEDTPLELRSEALPLEKALDAEP